MHCGTLIAGASDEQLRASRQAPGIRARGRLRMQLLISVTLFVVGALWLIYANLQGDTADRLLPGFLTAGGLIWYAGVRLLLWLRNR
ncbi:MAG: hypothetical protein H0W33_03215 [Gammaproteobacteria bacterium]|nr:hypothetical protein [Gammaproteobacteria bacterium]